MNPLPRLLGYSRRYRGRFVVAFAAMLVYAAASAAVAYLIKPIIDDGLLPSGAHVGLPDPGTLAFWSGAVLVAYLVKGLGAYFSAYLMTDIGQRVVRDLRNQLFKHILDQSAGVLQPLVHRAADVADHQRRQPGAAGRVRNGRRSAPRRAVAHRLRGAAVLLGLAPRAGLRHRRAAGRLSAGPARAARPAQHAARSQEAIERLSHIAAEAFTGHRIVKAFGAEEHESQRFRRASQLLYRTNLKITSTVAILPPLMEFLGGLAVVGLIWYGSGAISAAAAPRRARSSGSSSRRS